MNLLQKKIFPFFSWYFEISGPENQASGSPVRGRAYIQIQLGGRLEMILIPIRVNYYYKVHVKNMF